MTLNSGLTGSSPASLSSSSWTTWRRGVQTGAAQFGKSNAAVRVRFMMLRVGAAARQTGRPRPALRRRGV